MKNINHIEIYENVLTSEQCKEVIERVYDAEKLLVSNKKNPVTHQPIYYFLQIKPKTDPILSGPIQETILKYAYKHPFLIDTPDAWEIDEDANLQWYQPGMSFGGEHMENAAIDSHARRVLAWMIYLNTVTDGGGTRWVQQEFTSNAVEGSMIVWPAGWTHSHKGIVSNTQDKYIVTGWCTFVPLSKVKKGFK